MTLKSKKSMKIRILCPIGGFCYSMGVQLDEPSSPISKHFDCRHGDNGKLTWRDNTAVNPSRSPTQGQDHHSGGQRASLTNHCNKDEDKLPRQRCSNDALNNSKARSWQKKEMKHENKDDARTMSFDTGDNCCSETKRSHDGQKDRNNDVNVTFTLDEDEGLGIRDSDSSLYKGDDSSLYKGDYSNSQDSKHESTNSSNENSETEISENIDSIELSEVSVELSDLTRDGFQTCSAQESDRRKSKDAKKKRFHRLMRKPAIKRSQSLGCEKDLVPEHALFLQFNPEDFHGTDSSDKDKNDGQRRTIYKTTSADAAMMAEEVLPLDTQEKSKHKSSIAKNVRRRLQKLHRRNTDSFLGAAIMSIKGSKVTQTEAMEWGNSFEALLMDKNGLDMFRNFLKSEFSEENIEFWIACEEFKTTRTNKLTTKAQKIYSDFVATNAPKQINLDSKTRLDTVTNLDNPTRDLFRQAQKRIQFLMENDSYKRFLETDMYKNLIQAPSSST